MIKIIYINSFRGLKNIEIKLNNNISVFYGKNGIGKTRILNFITEFKKFIFGDDFLEVDISGSITFENNDKIELSVYNKQLLKFVVISENKEVCYLDENGKVNLFEFKQSDVFSTNDRDIIKTYNHYMNTPYLKLYVENQKLMNADNINSICKPIMELLNIDIFTENKVFDKFWQEKILIDAKVNIERLNFESSEVKMYKKKMDKEFEKYQKLQKNLSKILNIIDFNIKKYWVEKDEINFKIKHKVLLDDGLVLDLFNNNVSNGIRHFFKIIIPIIDVVKNENKILLIDEFDPYLHDFLYKSLVSNIIDELKPSSQIIFVSHNSNIINILPLISIYFISAENEKIDVSNPKSQGSNSKTTNFEKQYHEGKLLTQEIYDSDLMELFDDE